MRPAFGCAAACDPRPKHQHSSESASMSALFWSRIGASLRPNALGCTLNALHASRTQQLLSQRSASSQQQPAHQAIFDNVNQLISSKELGQTFAVIHLYGQEYVVHLGDIITVQKAFPAEIGEKIKLEKCMLLGNKDFTLIGRPLLNRDLVQVEATIIEKTMSHTYFNMFHIPRSRGYRRYRFMRNPLTMLRISEISVCHPLNTTQKKIN